MKPLFYNDPDKKAELLQRAVDHRKADDLTQGTYLLTQVDGDFKGCAVACLSVPVDRKARNRVLGGLRAAATRVYGRTWGTTPAFNNETAQRILGRHYALPKWTVRLADDIFEALDVKRSRRWPERLVEALPVGAEIPASALHEAIHTGQITGLVVHGGVATYDAPEWDWSLEDDVNCDTAHEHAAETANSLLRWIRKQG